MGFNLERTLFNLTFSLRFKNFFDVKEHAADIEEKMDIEVIS